MMSLHVGGRLADSGYKRLSYTPTTQDTLTLVVTLFKR
jgi:hypothetical protein